MSCTPYKSDPAYECGVCAGCLMWDVDEPEGNNWQHVLTPADRHKPYAIEASKKWPEPPIVTLIRETNRLLERLDRHLRMILSKEIDEGTL